MARPAPSSASPPFGRPAVSHRSMFDALKIEGEDSSDDEVEQPVAAPKAAAAKKQQQVQQAAGSVVEQVQDAVGAAVELAQDTAASVAETVVPLTRRAEKKLARQAALKAAALTGGAAAPATSSSSSSSDAGSPSPPPGKIDITLAKDSHLDPPVAALAASTPEVEALKEMGVENDGSGPAAGLQPTPESKGITGRDQAEVKEIREDKIDHGLLDSQQSSAAAAKKAAPASSNGKGGLPHPFSPSNLPSLPSLPDPKKSVPSKRGPSPDFPGTEKKEKKVVRFDGSEAAPTDLAAAGPTEAELAKQKRIKDASTRTASTFAMIAGFFGASSGRRSCRSACARRKTDARGGFLPPQASSSSATRT